MKLQYLFPVRNKYSLEHAIQRKRQIIKDKWTDEQTASEMLSALTTKLPKYLTKIPKNERCFPEQLPSSNPDRIRYRLPGWKLTWCSCSSDCWVASSSPWLPEAEHCKLLRLADRCVRLTGRNCWGLIILGCCDGNTLPYPSMQTDSCQYPQLSYTSISIHMTNYPQKGQGHLTHLSNDPKWEKIGDGFM